MKYNYNLDEDIQTGSSFPALLQLSSDGKNITILNKKPRAHQEEFTIDNPYEDRDHWNSVGKTQK